MDASHRVSLTALETPSARRTCLPSSRGRNKTHATSLRSRALHRGPVLLASAPKDRTSSEHADWVAAKVALGEALVEIPDYAHCVHTRAGQELGRGLMQWWDNGAHVRDELPGADHRYRAELIEIHRRDEAENGTAAPGCD